MEHHRKRAYRYLLYQFLLDIRTAPTPDSSAYFTDEQCRNQVNYAGAVAYLLHNFALAAADDFIAFDEATFWQGIESFSQANPQLSVLHFKKVFEMALTDSQ
ncbi:hypothetical protein I2I05_17355 [Hymenobacter sp. BT683]|uniref:Uncharacterized protein n=1 Tax=Hymenobacter jeongseonensis TaxID=2791027 RepID=A0ABS0ILC3_9BACT|nr:hypothetical protein [Hymenobacter jeongseonensis]MBF9239175.1 hypothetical protein [Hymenobacter jeongseonensis]